MWVFPGDEGYGVNVIPLKPLIEFRVIRAIQFQGIAGHTKFIEAQLPLPIVSGSRLVYPDEGLFAQHLQYVVNVTFVFFHMRILVVVWPTRLSALVLETLPMWFQTLPWGKGWSHSVWKGLL